MKVLVAGAAGLVAFLAVVALVVASRGGPPELADTPAGPFRGSEAPAGIRLPSFSLRDESGRRVRAADLRGRVLLLTFLDAQCTESCPVIAWEVARTLDALEAGERRRVVAVGISTDPAEDTPEAVGSFLRRQHAQGRLRYLTGSLATMRSLWRAFQILPSVDSGSDSLHSAPVRIYSSDGEWLATLHAGADLTKQNLLHDVRVALDRG